MHLNYVNASFFSESIPERLQEFLRYSKTITQEALDIAISEAFSKIPESDVFKGFEPGGLFI